jgi:hypothetical protein
VIEEGFDVHISFNADHLCQKMSNKLTERLNHYRDTFQRCEITIRNEILVYSAVGSDGDRDAYSIKQLSDHLNGQDIANILTAVDQRQQDNGRRGKNIQFALGCVPCIGPACNMYSEFHKGNYGMCAMDGFFLVADVATLGGSSTTTPWLRPSFRYLGEQATRIGLRNIPNRFLAAGVNRLPSVCVRGWNLIGGEGNAGEENSGDRST